MSPEVLMVLRLLLATLLGGAIGIERELTGKSAGFRTHILVCLGATLFTLTSIYGFGLNVDSARVAAGVVTGVGFLGAGAIIHIEGGSVAGLTTAASIWMVAAVGMVAATGLYWLAGAATVIALLVLRFPERRLRR